MERREVDSQERSNRPTAKNKTDTRGTLVVQEGGRRAQSWREEGAGLAKGQAKHQSWGLCGGGGEGPGEIWPAWEDSVLLWEKGFEGDV